MRGSVSSDSDYRVSTQRGYILVERPRGHEVVWSEQQAFLQRIAESCKEAGWEYLVQAKPRTNDVPAPRRGGGGKPVLLAPS